MIFQKQDKVDIVKEGDKDVNADIYYLYVRHFWKTGKVRLFWSMGTGKDSDQPGLLPDYSDRNGV